MRSRITSPYFALSSQDSERRTTERKFPCFSYLMMVSDRSLAFYDFCLTECKYDWSLRSIRLRVSYPGLFAEGEQLCCGTPVSPGAPSDPACREEQPGPPCCLGLIRKGPRAAEHDWQELVMRVSNKCGGFIGLRQGFLQDLASVKVTVTVWWYKSNQFKGFVEFTGQSLNVKSRKVALLFDDLSHWQRHYPHNKSWMNGTV